MNSPVSRLKHQLSHIKRDSWHWQLAQEVWGRRARGKACTYYWGKLPGALLVWGVLEVIVYIFSVGGWFLGFRPESWSSDGWFHPYKVSASGKKYPLAPWEIAAILGILWAIYYLTFVDIEAGKSVGMVVGGLVVFALAAFVLLKAKLVRSSLVNVLGKMGLKIQSAWNKACPPLIIEYPEE